VFKHHFSTRRYYLRAERFRSKVRPDVKRWRWQHLSRLGKLQECVVFFALMQTHRDGFAHNTPLRISERGRDLMQLLLNLTSTPCILPI